MRNLATLFVGDLRKCHQSIPRQKNVSIQIFSPLVCFNMPKFHNLATLQCKIWQHCSSEPFENVTSRFPVQNNISIQILALSSVSICINMPKFHNLATLQCEIWQPCSSDTSENVTNRFPVQKNRSMHIFNSIPAIL